MMLPLADRVSHLLVKRVSDSHDLCGNIAIGQPCFRTIHMRLFPIVTERQRRSSGMLGAPGLRAVCTVLAVNTGTTSIGILRG